MLEAAFHCSMLLYYLYADATMIKGLLNAHSLRGRGPDDPSTNRIVYGTLTYITIWNMIIQQMYFVMRTVDHLKRIAGRRDRSQPTNGNFLLRSVLFPTTCAVSMLYWWYYWRSPRLIFGDILAEIYPWWVDHAMHTFIVPIAFFELYLSSSSANKAEKEEASNIRGWLVFNAFITFYATVVTIAHIIRGVWPYPFLDPVNDGNPLIFFLSLFSIGWMWYFVGILLANKVWGCHYKIKEKSRRV